MGERSLFSSAFQCFQELDFPANTDVGVKRALGAKFAPLSLEKVAYTSNLAACAELEFRVSNQLAWMVPTSSKAMAGKNCAPPNTSTSVNGLLKLEPPFVDWVKRTLVPPGAVNAGAGARLEG
jgi:hypothetical protein